MIIEFDVIIIGAGPAGLFTAVNIRTSQKILIIEKNRSAGKKLLMSGSGKCNITQNGNIEDFFTHYGDNFRFLIPALKEFNNNHLINYLEEHGIPIMIDKNGKIFPESEYAEDILDMLLSDCKLKKIAINYNEEVTDIKIQNGKFIIKTFQQPNKSTNQQINKSTNYKIYSSSKLVIATGGKSYPTTGSTGDGYSFTKSLGHSIEKPKPALTPVYIKNYRFKEISGVSLENRKISLYRSNKKIREHEGDIVFTHWGISGPGILDFSRYIEANDILKINLIDKNIEYFRKILNETASKDGKMSIKRFLKSYEIPESLIKLVISELNIDTTTHLADINKNFRNRIVELFCEYPFIVEGTGDFNIAMVTKGGVSLKEVNSKTMESKLVKNLYFVGEVLDIDGDTGGYNMQAAFSTGYLVGKNL
jgi:predicted Rossmann fold flavoprotein